MYSHGAVAAKYFGQPVVETAFADYRKAEVRVELKLMLQMLHKLTLEPQAFGVDDVRPLLDAGITPVAIEHGVLIGGYLFNMHNRVIDALGCDIPPDKVDRAAAALNQVGKKPLDHRLRDGQMIPYKGKRPEPVETLIEAIESGPGAADPMLRTAIMYRAARQTGVAREALDVPTDLHHFVDTIARRAVDVTDADIDRLKQHGYSEHEIFEFTIAASAGAGIARLELAWEMLAQA